MLTRRNLVSAIAVLGANCALVQSAAAQKQPVPVPANKVALAQDQVQELLLLMDADKNGKISKAEWMNFMSAEFDRLDTDHSGQLDVKEIAYSRLRATRRVNTGK
jgi:EF hand